jgi:hypothetical protein
MKLNNFEIRRLDALNITYKEYREVEKKDHSKVMAWVESGKYYSTVKDCLEGIKNHIINDYINLDDYDQVLNKIKELNGAIVECKLMMKQ